MKNYDELRPKDLKLKDFEKIYLFPYGFKPYKYGKGSHFKYKRKSDGQVFPVSVHNGVVQFGLIAKFRRLYVNKP